MSHKIVEQLRYTETVYYDDDGNEVERVRNHDDSLWDESVPIPLTRQEQEDYLDG